MAALHVTPDLCAGKIGVRYGAILGSSDELTITVKGKGGHGAHPDTVIDPILLAAQIVTGTADAGFRELAADESVLSPSAPSRAEMRLTSYLIPLY